VQCPLPRGSLSNRCKLARVAVAEPGDVEVLERFPDERVTRDNVDFYRGLLREELRANRCLDCGRWHLPHRAFCPDCWSSRVVAAPVSGRGTVHLLIFLHQGRPIPGIDYAAGHPVATIELEEQVGLRFTAALTGCPREQMCIGMPVELCFVERGGQRVPAFRPAAGPV
jgi:uncharacterized protein